VSYSLLIRVHEIQTDGLPDMTELTGRVAFITEGVIVSGYPLLRGPSETGWEADPDIFGCCPPAIQGVTHWVEFPLPVEELTSG